VKRSSRIPWSNGSRTRTSGLRGARDMPAGARPGPLPTFLEPSLATLAAKPPCGPQWIHEIKFDGYRMQARVDGGEVRLLTHIVRKRVSGLRVEVSRFRFA
jgi:bifunctional non-homologous end joining protein LigD